MDLTFYLFTYIHFNPSIINIQCHMSFRCTVRSFSNTTGIFLVLSLWALWHWDLSQAYCKTRLCAGESETFCLYSSFVRPIFTCPGTVAHPVSTSVLKALDRGICPLLETPYGNVLPTFAECADNRTVLLHAGSARRCPSVLTELKEYFH